MRALLTSSGLATIANMGAEVGATTSTFPYTQNMRAYLNATGRAPVARAADEAAANGFLSADEGAEYDEVIEIVRSFYNHCPIFELISLRRISRSWNQLSMDLSPPTWQLLCQNLPPSLKNKAGKTNCLLDLLDLVPIAHTKTW